MGNLGLFETFRRKDDFYVYAKSHKLFSISGLQMLLGFIADALVIARVDPDSVSIVLEVDVLSIRFPTTQSKLIENIKVEGDRLKFKLWNAARGQYEEIKLADPEACPQFARFIRERVLHLQRNPNTKTLMAPK